MTVTAFNHVGPWSDEEYLALEVTEERVELFDGSLHVSPAPSLPHQHLSQELLVVLRAAARAAGCRVFTGINLRLRPGRITIPDLLVSDNVPVRGSILEAHQVRLVCEIVSPSNAATDKVLKMHYYAVAGIGWYLLVEQETATLHLYRLSGDRYVEHSVTRPGGRLVLTEPVHAVLEPAALLPDR